MGVKKIYLINACRVEKSHWQTPFLKEDAVREQLMLGLEQARDTVLPSVELRQRFRPFVEDELPGLIASTLPLVAHWASRIGSLPNAWNHLVTEYPYNPHAKLVHFTLGTPCFAKYANCDYADEWRAEKSLMLGYNAAGEFRKEKVA